ncbi:hypothetical protein ANTRET_LOCUS3855 [Anthophora retusa]
MLDHDDALLLAGEYEEFFHFSLIDEIPVALISQSKSTAFEHFIKSRYSFNVFKQFSFLHLLWKLHQFVIVASSQPMLRLIFQKIKDSPWANFNGFHILIDRKTEEHGCINAYRFLWTAWEYDRLSTIFLCIDPEEGLLLYTYNPYSNVAPSIWQDAGQFKGRSGHPWILLKRNYLDGSLILSIFCKDVIMPNNSASGVSSLTSATVAPTERVSIRIPEFTPDDPELWFCILERNLVAAGITLDGVKASYVTGALGPRYIAEVRDILLNPPDTGLYDKLKTELIRRLSVTQEQKARRLLEHEEIGDRRPSQFLRHLRSLAGTCVSEPLLRTLWLGRLPSSVQAILATQQGTALDKVAELADAIVDTMPGRPAIAETTRPVPATPATPTDLLTERMMQMLIAMQEQTETMKTILQPPYDGPYEVVSRDDKTFTLKIDNKLRVVSINRIKPAYITSEEIAILPDQTQFLPLGRHTQSDNETARDSTPSLPPVTNAQHTYTIPLVPAHNTEPTARFSTRSGRRVRFPERFQAGFA